MKEHNHFDRIIKEKVNNYSVPVEDGAWELFAEKQKTILEAELLEEDLLLDEKAALLESFESPLNRNHWALMAERIQKELIFIRELTHLKVMELSLMVLMLLSLWQQFPFQNTIDTIPYHSTNIAQRNDVEEPEAIESTTVTNEIIPQKTIRRSIKNNAIPSHNLQGLSEHALDIKAVEFQKNALKVVEMLPEKVISTPISKKELHPFPNAENIKTFPPKALVINSEVLEVDYHPNRKKALVRIGMIGRLETNIIVGNTANIPTDQLIQTSIYRRQEGGYSGGMSIGLQKNKWEYQLKFLYTAVQYQPIDVINVAGSTAKNYIGKKYVNFEFNTFQIPVAVRYNIIDRNHWKFFTALGVSWHTIVQSYYHAREEDFTNDHERETTAPRWIPEPIGHKEALPGFFQANGRFLKNSFVTGNIGFGVERSFGDRWSTFIASRYAHSLYNFNGGVGPYKDNIHNMSFESGIIVTFGR